MYYGYDVPYNGVPVGFNYATSTDGITWTRNTSNPVPPIVDDSQFGTTFISLPNVTKIGATWYMVFEGVQAGEFHIFMATSADGHNWMPANGGNPIYTGGADGSWDATGQANPALYEIDPGKYIILYNGSPYSNGAVWDLGVLSSVSLTSGWTSWPGNPVISRGADGAWDDTRIEGLRMLKDDLGKNTLRAWYFGIPTGSSYLDSQIGFATSSLPEQDDSAVLWVEVKDDLSSQQSIYVYYGNDLATTTSNIVDTMIKGDDGVDFDLTYNTAGSALITHTGGQINMNGSDGIEDGWIIGENLSGIPTFHAQAKSISGGGTSNSDAGFISLGLYDGSGVPSPMENTPFNNNLRLSILRYGGSHTSTPNQLYVTYVDTGGMSHFWDGNSWESTISPRGGAGDYTLAIWDDGINYFADILDQAGNSLFFVASKCPNCKRQKLCSWGNPDLCRRLHQLLFYQLSI